MTHLLVAQLRFARTEFQRCFVGVSGEDARKRILPMNCLSWIIGHLANQENSYWNILAQGQNMAPGLNDLVGYGKPVLESVGTLLLRNTYHYWFHTGEAYGIRQALGHTGLPDFVGNMSDAAYHPE